MSPESSRPKVIVHNPSCHQRGSYLALRPPFAQLPRQPCLPRGPFSTTRASVGVNSSPEEIASTPRTDNHKKRIATRNHSRGEACRLQRNETESPYYYPPASKVRCPPRTLQSSKHMCPPNTHTLTSNLSTNHLAPHPIRSLVQIFLCPCVYLPSLKSMATVPDLAGHHHQQIRYLQCQRYMAQKSRPPNKCTTRPDA